MSWMSIPNPGAPSADGRVTNVGLCRHILDNGGPAAEVDVRHRLKVAGRLQVLLHSGRFRRPDARRLHFVR